MGTPEPLQGERIVDELVRFRCPFCELEAGCVESRTGLLVVHTLPMCASYQTLDALDYLSFLTASHEIRSEPCAANDAERKDE